MEPIRIKLAATWVVVMLIYLLGDVLRIMSGDFKKMMETTDVPFTKGMWLGISALMLLPILMVFFSVTLPPSVCRWANIALAGFFLLFNAVGIPTYLSMYDQFLLAVSLVFNGATLWYAWNWVP
ncbi:MAG: hypothetical protein H6727_18245 [Myxococcales bacterium]|nr:hypothetical protein [Myxococcales bacterium]